MLPTPSAEDHSVCGHKVQAVNAAGGGAGARASADDGAVHSRWPGMKRNCGRA